MKKIFKEVFYFTRCNLGAMLKIIWPFLLLSICMGIPLDYLGKVGVNFFFLERKQSVFIARIFQISK